MASMDAARAIECAATFQPLATDTLGNDTR